MIKSGWSSKFALALIATAAGAEPMPQVSTPFVQPMKIEIPNEMAPAAQPYLICMLQAFNSQARAADGIAIADLPTANAAAQVSCSSVRKAALKRGVELLAAKDIGNNAEERAEKVEQSLALIDSIHAKAPDLPRPDERN